MFNEEVLEQKHEMGVTCLISEHDACKSNLCTRPLPGGVAVAASTHTQISAADQEASLQNWTV